MARMARLVVPDLAHHVTQRGNRGQEVFFDDADYRRYVELLGERAQERGLDIWAYCLMPNHVHLIAVPETEDSLRAAVAEAHRRYTRHVNAREGWCGHLWQERFHSFPLDEAHLFAAVRYVERNPVRARLVARPEDWPWSSARAHLGGAADPLLSPAPALEAFGDWRVFLGGAEDEAELTTLRRHGRTGRPLGDDDFVRALERTTGRRLGRRRRGRKPEAKTPAG